MTTHPNKIGSLDPNIDYVFELPGHTPNGLGVYKFVEGKGWLRATFLGSKSSEMEMTDFSLVAEGPLFVYRAADLCPPPKKESDGRWTISRDMRSWKVPTHAVVTDRHVYWRMGEDNQFMVIDCVTGLVNRVLAKAFVYDGELTPWFRTSESTFASYYGSQVGFAESLPIREVGFRGGGSQGTSVAMLLQNGDLLFLPHEFRTVIDLNPKY